MLRTAAALGLAVLVGLTPTALPAAAAPAVDGPVIAMIDSGVRATHQEFDYRGSRSTSDQFVAWWDFTSEVKGKNVFPGPGELWDPAVRDPYDTLGHGTVTAAMAAGRGADPRESPSASPGAKLAIARTADAAGISRGVAEALRWATDTVHADVISLSLASIVPVPASLVADTHKAIAYARSRGVLVVIAGGNGYGNALVPGDPGWASWYSCSPDALIVGALGTVYGALASTDPEVTATFQVGAPAITGDGDYQQTAGTSFSAPYVAGFAAALVRAAKSGGHPLSAPALEQLVKYSAYDSGTPPNYEGYGWLTQKELPAALAHAKAGTLPSRPSPDVSGIYVEQVQGTLRSTWTTYT